MNFDLFLNLFNNTLVDFDNYYGDQCVDLVQFWSRAIGGPRFTGDAYQLANQTLGFYTWVVNTPEGVPQKGDIVVWNKAFNGIAGHTGIATGKGDTNTFECFEQNDPLDSNCHLQIYNYNSVVGWLRPNSVSIPQTDELKTCTNDRDTNWNCFKALTEALGVPEVQDKEKYKQDALDAIGRLKRAQTPVLANPSESERPSDVYDRIADILRKLFHG